MGATTRHRLHILAVVLGGLVMAGPLLYLVSLSLMKGQDVRAYPPNLLPPSPRFSNYTEAIDLLKVRTIVNSFIFSISVVVIQGFLALTAGFALAKIPFRGSTAVTLLFSASLFVPGPITLIPTYLVVRELDWINTYQGLILPIAAQTGFGTLLFRQFFVKLPTSLLDAARVDGASWFQVFYKIAVPLARPIVGAYAAVSFLTAWNMYVWPLVIATGSDLRVLPVALAPLAGPSSLVPLNVAMAAVMISTIPLLIVFLFSQRSFVRGLTSSGID